MCGIVGIVGAKSENDLAWMYKACDKLKHRGPDASGMWISSDKKIALGHRRLSIIDIKSKNNQPFISKDGLLSIVFNGEIYNYVELRKELEVLGERFHTKGDTEVLLAAYRHWGIDCLSKLNGMWAFAIWDRRQGERQEKLFFARDRVGEKPFYYRYQKDCFEFSSELKGLPLKDGIDVRALNHYLALGYVPSDLCIASGVHKLQAGCAGLYNHAHQKLKIWSYWQLPKQKVKNTNFINEEKMAEKVWSLLVDSTRLRLRSDVPTGVFLSGGLDSSLITAATAQICNHPIHTFTIGNPGSTVDETHYARLVANTFRTKHQVLPIEEPSLSIIEELSPFIDEPIADSSILPMFLISRLTRQHVTVALGGDGGDELYGGYHHYQTALRNDTYLGWLPKPLFVPISHLAKKLPPGIHGRNYLSSLQGGPRQAYIWGTPYFDVELRHRILSPDVLVDLGSTLNEPEHTNLSLLSKSQHLVDGLTRLDFQQTLVDDFLVKVDRASMAHGLEVRTPFLDYRLIEQAFSEIPPHWKCTIHERRRIQNLMAKKYLPKNFTLNRKQGLSIPIDQWMQTAEIQEQLTDLPRDLINHTEVIKLCQGQLRNRTNGARLFALLMLDKALKNLI